MSDSDVFYYVVKSEIFKRSPQRVNMSRPRMLDLLFHKNGEIVRPISLKYFCQPHPSDLPLNLNIGYEDYTLRNEDYFNFSTRKIEKFLMENNGRSLLKNKSKQQFCTSRNALKCLMMTPYTMRPGAYDNWTIRATKFEDVIYVTKSKAMQRHKNRYGTYHFKLHQYCFSDSPHKKPETDEPIDENTQMSGIFRTNIDDFELLYSAEIVGVESKEEIKNLRSEDTLNKCNFVFTKLLCDKFQSSKWKLHKKMFNTWIQAYLTSVKTVYVGFRTENGLVNRKLEEVKTQDLPKDQIWKTEVCKRFMRDFLAKVQEKMSNVDCPYTVYQFTFDAKLQIIKYRVYEGKNEHSFLGENFIQYMRMN